MVAVVTSATQVAAMVVMTMPVGEEVLPMVMEPQRLASGSPSKAVRRAWGCHSPQTALPSAS